MNDDHLPDGEILTGWQGHPGTQWFVMNLQRVELVNALTELVGHARNSTDANVRGAVMRYDTINQVISTMVPKPEQASEDSEREEE